MTLKGALLLSRLVNRSAHLWFAVQFAVSWCARGERPIDEAIRRLAVGRKNVYSASEGKPASFCRAQQLEASSKIGTDVINVTDI